VEQEWQTIRQVKYLSSNNVDLLTVYGLTDVKIKWKQKGGSVSKANTIKQNAHAN